MFWCIYPHFTPQNYYYPTKCWQFVSHDAHAIKIRVLVDEISHHHHHGALCGFSASLLKSTTRPALGSTAITAVSFAPFAVASKMNSPP